MKIVQTGVEAFDKAMTEYCARGKFSGLVRITHRDEIIYQRCEGIENPETGEKITENTHFTFYSLSKPFCALGIMKLVDKGLVSLSAHPGEYVPEARGFDEGVTVYDMLHHTSGMPDFADCDDYEIFSRSREALDMRKKVKELAKYPPHFAPGTSTLYANINFALCAMIIEDVAKREYSEYMKSEVFEPLGMKTAAIDKLSLRIEHRATGFEEVDGEIVPVQNNISWMLGGGDINGTADDVYCLNQAIKNRLLVSEKAWKEILTPADINSFGCGCSVSLWHGKERITHNGGHIGFRTLHIQLPEEDFDIIILSNYGFGTPREDLSEMIYEAFFGGDNEPTEKIVMDGRYVK